MELLDEKLQTSKPQFYPIPFTHWAQIGQRGATLFRSNNKSPTIVSSINSCDVKSDMWLPPLWDMSL